MTTQNVKQYKSKAELLQILQSRELIIDDLALASEILDRISYYRLSGYTLSLKTGDAFREGIHFENILDLYNFDVALRSLILKYTEPVEIQIRNAVANHHGHIYSSTGYLDKNNFYSADYHAKFIEQLEKEKNRSKELFVRHHKEKYNSTFPIWVCTEILDFSTISMLYNNLLLSDKKAIAEKYYNDKHTYISNWLHALCILRNIAAHRGRLYNRYMPFAVKLGTDYNSIDNHRIFAYILVLRKIQNNADIANSLIEEFIQLVNQCKNIDLKLIGCPENWKDILSLSE